MRAGRCTALKNGEMAERSNAAVLKTVEVKASRGSNPFLSATHWEALASLFFVAERKERLKHFGAREPYA